MADENYIEVYADDETHKEGTLIKGKDVIQLEAPEVLLSPDTPLLTEAQDVAGAINELFRSGSGGGDDVYIVQGSPSELSVTVVRNRSSDAPEYEPHTFYFTSRQFKKTTTISSGKGSKTTEWCKTIITSIADDSGEIIFTLTPNNNGDITAVYDRAGNEILAGISADDSVTTSTPEGIALGWALAYNEQQSKLTDEKEQAYKDGIEDGKELDPDPDPDDIDDLLEKVRKKLEDEGLPPDKIDDIIEDVRKKFDDFEDETDIEDFDYEGAAGIIDYYSRWDSNRSYLSERYYCSKIVITPPSQPGGKYSCNGYFYRWILFSLDAMGNPYVFADQYFDSDISFWMDGPGGDTPNPGGSYHIVY